MNSRLEPRVLHWAMKKMFNAMVRVDVDTGGGPIFSLQGQKPSNWSIFKCGHGHDVTGISSDAGMCPSCESVIHVRRVRVMQPSPAQPSPAQPSPARRVAGWANCLTAQAWRRSRRSSSRRQSPTNPRAVASLPCCSIWFTVAMRPSRQASEVWTVEIRRRRSATR